MVVDNENELLRAPLKRFARFRSGGAIDSLEISREGEFPVFGGNGIRGYTSKSNLQGSNLLVGRQGALSGNVHRVIGPIWASEHALIASLSELIDFDFAYYLLQSMNLNQYSQAAAQPGISASVIQAATATIPKAKSEQRLIAEFLDRKTAEIDGLVGKLQREVELLERYRRELIAHTVTRGLDPDAPMKDSGIEWAGLVPDTWTTYPFMAIFRLEKRANTDLTSRNALQFKDGHIVAKPDWDNSDRSLDETLSSYKLVEPGMIVINGLNLNYDFKTKRIGLVTEPGVITSAYITLSLLPRGNERFVSYLLKSMDSRLLFHGMTEGVRKILAWRDIRRELLPIPPLDDQEAIANFLDSKMAEIDSTVAGINKQIELLGRYRKQVINDAVTGKVRVGEVA